MLKKINNLLVMIAVAVGVELCSYILQEQLKQETSQISQTTTQASVNEVVNNGTPEPSVSATPSSQNKEEKDQLECLENDCNCSDFTTQAEARIVLDAEPGDPHRLDANGDGTPCESLPPS